jgi:hypothetical protein
LTAEEVVERILSWLRETGVEAAANS